MGIKERERLKLYLRGYTDVEIARRTGFHESTINKWRHRRGLPAHNRRIPLSEERHRMKLYRKGYTDAEIADRVGVTKRAICSWRTKRHLPPNE